MAAPTKLTDEVRETIASALRNGNTIRVACALASISVEVYYSWMHRGQAQERGEEKKNGHHAFLLAVTRAEADAEKHFVGVIHEAAPKDWRAAESWLKRRRREEWGDSVSVDIDASIAATLNQIASLTVTGTTDSVNDHVIDGSPLSTAISVAYIDPDPST